MPQKKSETIRKLRDTIAELRARGETDEAIIKAFVAAIPPDRLEALHREAILEDRSELSSAIGKAVYNRANTFAIPGFDAAVKKALSGEAR